MTHFKIVLAFMVMMIGASAAVATDVLDATFLSSNANPLPEQPFYFSVQVTNKGTAPSSGNRVSVSRFTVSSTGQIGSFGTKLGGFSGQAINNLQPGQTANFDFVDQRPAEGTFLYRVSFLNPGTYKTKEMEVTFARQQPIVFTAVAPLSAPGEAIFVVLNQFPKPNQNFPLTVKLTNRGTTKFVVNKLSITRHTVSTGGFVDTAGSPIGSQNVPALAVGESANLPFADGNPPEGKFVYRMQFASPGIFRQQEMTVAFTKGSQVTIR